LPLQLLVLLQLFFDLSTGKYVFLAAERNKQQSDADSSHHLRISAEDQ
jgi:hypothetical protein